MHQSSVVMVGNFSVPVTPNLRELFSRTHAAMSGEEPTSQQFMHDEQYEMYLVCQIAHKGKKGKLDKEQTEDNLLELIDFLFRNGVPVREIIGEIRCFGKRTRGVAIRLHCEEIRQHKAEAKKVEAEAQAVMPKAVPHLLFAEPSLQEAIA